MKISLASKVASIISVAALLCGANSVYGQSTVVPVPFVSTFAGIGTGTGNTQCPVTSDIPNVANQHVGDGCLPTQAVLGGLFDVYPDASGNVLISENGAGSGYTLQDIRVVYGGGTNFTALLRAANPALQNVSLQQGHIYTLAGGLAGSITAKNTILYCGNVIGNPQAFDKEGNGCPAAEAYIRPRGMAVDPYGDVYFVNNASLYNNLRVIYNGGPKLTTLLALLYPGLVPQIGYIYRLGVSAVAGYTPDGQLVTNTTFFTVRYVALDSAGNIYISDGAPHNTTTKDPSGNVISAIDVSASSVRKIDINTGIVMTVAGENNCATAGPYSPLTTYGCQFGPPVEGAQAVTNAAPGPASNPYGVGNFDAPYAIAFDKYDNLYIADAQNARIRVVYAGGTIPGITNPVVGAAYTYAGGGTLQVDGTPAKSVKFNSLQSMGIDKLGNIYAVDTGSTRNIWKFDAVTAVGTIIASTKTSTAGTACFGTNGPVASDALGDGCPATQATYNSTIGNVRFDNQGSMYISDSTVNIIRKFTYNNVFPATPDGTPVTQQLAFKTTAAATLTGESFGVQGHTTGEYTDAGGSTCQLNTALSAGTLCLYNVVFNPAHDGFRPGSIQFVSAAGIVGSELLSGSGVAADIAIDTGTQINLGTGLTPTGVGTDLSGNVYVSDSKSNQVLAGASSGTTLTPLITGLNKPAQVSIDSLGNVYVADTGNNRIVETTSTGTLISALGTGLSGPTGVAVDPYGLAYVADTGNNRIVTVAPSGAQTIVPIVGLKAPTQLTFDPAGNLFIVDSGNARIVEYAHGDTTAVTLDSSVVPAGVAVDASGTIYVIDKASNSLLSYIPGGVTGNLLLSGLTNPVALAADADANLFIADTANSGATELRRTAGSFSFPITGIGQPTTVGVSVNNVGNAPLTFSSANPSTLTGSPYITIAPSTSNGCTTGSPVVLGAACTFTSTFAPTTTGPASATASILSNAADGGAVTALLSGTGYNLTATTTTLAITQPASGVVNFAQTAVVSATLVPKTTTVTPTGSFKISVDGKTPTTQPYGTGTISITIPNLVVGPHTVNVSYSGDTVYASSGSTLNIVVNKAPTTTVLTVTPISTAGSLTQTLSATVSSSTASGLTGTVSFYDGPTLLSTQTLSVAGTASYTSPLLSYTYNKVTAVYNGAANFASSTSAIATGTGDFAVGTASPSISVPQGAVVSASFQLASILGSTGTITPSCTNLPPNAVCRFQPVTIPLGTTQLTVSLQLYTSINPNAELHPYLHQSETYLAFGLPFGLAVILLRRRRSSLVRLLVVFAGLGLAGGFIGCGTGSSSSSPYTTPAGTYTINVIFTGSSGLTTTHSVPVQATVLSNPNQL